MKSVELTDGLRRQKRGKTSPLGELVTAFLSEGLDAADVTEDIPEGNFDQETNKLRSIVSARCRGVLGVRRRGDAVYLIRL